MSLLTPEFRVSYPNVFKPQRNKLNGKDEYSLEAVFPKGADLSKLMKAAEDVLIERWGADKSKWPKGLRNPFKDQSMKTKDVDGKQVLAEPYEAGAIFLNLKSEQRPGVVNEQVQDIVDQKEFYPGCWARASVNAYAYDQAGNRGVNFGLVNVQKVKDGDPLGKRTRPEDDFAPVTKTETAQTSTDLFS